MPKQDITKSRTEMQNKILDLEKKYYSIIEDAIFSADFIGDLLLIEKEIRENYPKFKDTWDLKNKLKVPAERLVRHHLYMIMKDRIKGIYPSPISSDFGVKMEDCVLCIDVKTIDTKSNEGDLKATSVESNQTSFNNKEHKYINSLSNLESIDHYSRLPVLTYIIKIIYRDDNYSFALSRGTYPSIVLACLPNGELSNLFGFDIIQNFKTYKYYDGRDNDSLKPHYIPKEVPSSSYKSYTYNYCLSERGFQEVTLAKGKTAYYDAENKCIWWYTSENNKPAIRAVKNGSSMRYYNEILEDRFDSGNIHWTGYKESSIPDPLP